MALFFLHAFDLSVFYLQGNIQLKTCGDIYFLLTITQIYTSIETRQKNYIDLLILKPKRFKVDLSWSKSVFDIQSFKDF